MEKQHFIKTSDKNTADILRELGFVELPQEGSKWVFVNSPNKIEFSSEDLKVYYTDILTF